MDDDYDEYRRWDGDVDVEVRLVLLNDCNICAGLD